MSLISAPLVYLRQQSFCQKHTASDVSLESAFRKSDAVPVRDTCVFIFMRFYAMRLYSAKHPSS